MCPFGMIGVPARREYFGRFKGGYEAKAGSLAGYRSRGNNKIGDFGLFGDFGDFGVSFAATVAGRYTRRGGPRLSVQGEPLIVLTRGP